MTKWLAIVAVIHLIVASTFAATPTTTANGPDPLLDVKLVVGPPAKWVVPLSFQRLPPTASTAGEESRWLLSEKQINAQENETFVHTARQILTSAGVQSWSHYSIDFDPSYQTLILHWARVWRGKTNFNRLQPDKVKVIQPERDLDEFLFNGQKSAVMILDDVRVGDVVDIAYSVRGELPVFHNAFADSIFFQASGPVEHLSARLLWPINRRLYFKDHGPVPKVVPVRRATFWEYKWDLKNVPGLRSEGSLPPWYEPHPWLQISEMQTWAQVNLWAMRLFATTNKVSSELLTSINEWKRLPTPEARARAALRFVQEEVRYQGFEGGADGFNPGDASAVFARRYGDCKDKACLLVTILRAMQMDAAPVLVNTRVRQVLDAWQPSVLAFDHAIVQLNLSGETFWLDPTRTFQRGPLALHYLPNFARGLVIRPRTMALTVIPESRVETRRDVTETFTLRGIDQPSDFKVVTAVTGRDAEMLRRQIGTTPRAELEKTFLNFYAQQFNGVTESQPLTVSDDEERNRVEITENYSTAHVWQRQAEGAPYRCEFLPDYIGELVERPAVILRSMPLAIQYPAHQTFRIEADLPAVSIVPFEQTRVDDPAFSYQRKVTANLRKVIVEYEYQSKTEVVYPAGMNAYTAHLDEAARALGYWLTYP